MDGNKLRDVLRKARAFIDCSPLKKIEDDFGCIDRDEICAEINAALAEPVKNCEVGTAEEQIDRMLEFCGRKGKCTRCEHHKIGTMFRECTLRWAQMPYESEAAK